MKLKAREKKFLLLGGICAVIIMLYKYAWYPLFSHYTQLGEEVAQQVLLLEKNQLRIAQKERLSQQKEQQKQELAQQEKRLLPSNKPPIAAAELQKILKGIIKNNSGNTRSEKILTVEPIGKFKKIPVEITFRCLVTHLKDILFQTQNHQLLLAIPQITVKVVNRRSPKEVEARLIVVGLIRALE